MPSGNFFKHINKTGRQGIDGIYVEIITGSCIKKKDENWIPSLLPASSSISE
jgi:hypothetical protein